MTYPRRLKALWLVIFSCFLFALISGCSNSSDSKVSDTGELSIGLTDAPGDFATYTVSVVSISLTKANGATVETLPQSTEVDFAQYTSMTEFLTASYIPLGAYREATLTLDYTDADIQVENEEGDIVPVDTIVDNDGTPVTTFEVSVILENRNKLVIAPGMPSHLLLDFNLKASNRVAFTDEGDIMLVVEPTLMAEVDYESEKPYRLRGLLKKVDEAQGEFSLQVRPFYKKLKGLHSHFGNMTVQVSDQTIYDINMEAYEGADGLAVMAALPKRTAVRLEGTLVFKPKRFVATHVYAGSSVPGQGLDVITGNIVQRSGDTLTVKGVVLKSDDRRLGFKKSVTVTLGEDCIVRKKGTIAPMELDAVSPGQRVTVLGSLSTDDDNTEALIIDATAGIVILLPTTLKGTVVDNTDAMPVAVSLNAIDNRTPAIFDFQGTGIDEASDAEAGFYEVETGVLDISELIVNDPVKIIGFVSPFGTAPADFTAHTLVNLSKTRAFIKMDWEPSTTIPIFIESETRLSLNLDGTHYFHHLGYGGFYQDLNDLETLPVIEQPSFDEARLGTYILLLDSSKAVYNNLDEFSDAYELALESGKVFKSVFASGEYNNEMNIFYADYLCVKGE